MTYKGHAVGGAIAAVLAVKTFGVQGGALVGMVAAAMLGGLAPDLDHHASYLSRRLWPVRLALGLLMSNPLTWLVAGGGDRAKGESAVRIFRGRARVKKMLGHRQITHALLGLLAGTALWVGISWGLWAIAAAWAPALTPWLGGGRADPTDWVMGTTYGWALGWASHIVLDAMTVSGVPFLLPFTAKRMWVLPRLLRVRSSA